MLQVERASDKPPDNAICAEGYVPSKLANFDYDTEFPEVPDTHSLQLPSQIPLSLSTSEVQLKSTTQPKSDNTGTTSSFAARASAMVSNLISPRAQSADTTGTKPKVNIQVIQDPKKKRVEPNIRSSRNRTGSQRDKKGPNFL